MTKPTLAPANLLEKLAKLEAMSSRSEYPEASSTKVRPPTEAEGM